MERTATDVNGYLGTLEGKRGEDIRQLDELIREQLPQAERHLYEGKLWGGSDQQIVGYGILDYRNKSGDDVEWFLVGLAAQKDHLSIYVNAVEDGQYLLAQFEGRLGKVKLGSASMSFTSLDDVDMAALGEMLSRAGQPG